MTNLDEKVQIEGTAAEPEPAKKEPTPDAEEKRGRGRPKKGEEPEPKEPAARSIGRKPPQAIADPRGAIVRHVDALAVLFAAYQEAHPESTMEWAWKQLRATLPEEKGRIGAPIDESAFAPLVRGPCRGVEYLGDLPEEERATPEEINEVAESWARASTHLGMSERVAAVGSAVSKTVGLVGRQITRTVVAMMAPAPAGKIEAPAESMAHPEPAAAPEPEKDEP